MASASLAQQIFRLSSSNNNSVKQGKLQTFSQNIAVNFVPKLTIVEILT